MITDGEAKRSATARITRDGEVVGTYQIQSLKVLKDEKNVVKKGAECGVNVGKIAEEVKEEDTVTFIGK